MAFPASNILLADAYKQVKGTMFQVNNYAQGRSDLFATDSEESTVLAAVDNLTALKGILQANASAPGMAEYARIQEDDPTLDLVAEYQAVITAIDAVLDYISANIPAPRVFTIVALAPLKTLLDDLVLTIE